jgi:hypothetical protein
MSKRFGKDTRRRLGWILLAVAFFLGCLTVGWNQFGDEADNLVTGWLLTRGYELYRDVFSHHFPFAYYWSAAVIGLFGKSIFVARLSVWVFQIAAFGISMRLSRFYLPLGLASLIWSLLRHLYRANMLLYSPFCGASLVVVFAVTLAVILETTQADWRHSLAVGLFSAVALLSDPLSVYALSVALIYLLIKRRKEGLLALVFTALGLCTYATYLVASGTVQDFVRDAILFNTEVYAKYLQANHLRFGELLEMLYKGLGIVDPAWQNLDPFRAISLESTQFDRWAFTGLLYRLALVVGVISLLVRKRFRAGSFVYLFAAATLVINRWDFRAAGFVMISLVILAGVISQEWQPRPGNRTLVALQVGVSIVLGLTALWLGIRVVEYTFVQNRDMLRPGFGRYEMASAQIRELACGHEQDVVLGHYPAGTYYYWFTEMKPVSKYVFLWPWVAKVGLSEILDELDQEQTLALVYIEDGKLWGLYDSKDYLRPLHDYLEGHYIELEEGVYMSPYLAAQCQE